MENLVKILSDTFSVDNNVRLQAEMLLNNYILDKINLEICLKFLLDSQSELKCKKMLATFIKNYVSKYIVSNSLK